MLLNSITIISIVILLGSFVLFLYQQTILNQMSAFSLRDTKQVTNNIEFIQQDIEDLSNYITTDHTLQNLLNTSPDELNIINKDLDYIEYMLNNFLVSKDYVDFIGIYLDNGVNYYASTDGSNNTVTYNDFKDTDLYKRTLSQKGAPYWSFISETNSSYIVDNQKNKLSMSKSILHLTDYSIKAYLNISINISSLTSLFNDVLLVENSKILLLDPDNNIILEDTKADAPIESTTLPDSLLTRMKSLDSGTEIIELMGTKQHVSFSSINDGDFTLVYIVPISKMTPDTLSIQLFIAMILAIVFILGLIFTSYISAHLTKPILVLLDAMSSVNEDQLEHYVDVTYNDEIGQLANAYNKMIQKINTLINQVYKLEVEEKAAELKALQAQINPHFLYNTLDTIYWKAVAKDHLTVQNMIQSLSKMFRLTLNSGNEINYVYNEKELIINYINLQQMRFNNKLLYSITIDESMNHYELPKLILQPFVENAIVHGMEPEDKVTSIDIIGTIQDSKLCFVIKDNGSGISKDILADLLNPNVKKITEASMTTSNHNGYAIKNIMNRLDLYYANNYSLTITSHIGRGTTVTLCVPTEIVLHPRKEQGNV